MKRKPVVERLDSRLCMAFGDVDFSFGISGSIRQEFPLSNQATGFLSQTITLTDGSIVQLGEHLVGHGMLLSGIKLNTQGELSTTFGIDGRFQYPSHYQSVGPVYAYPTADGGFIVPSWNPDQPSELTKFTSNGLLDLDFGDNGLVRLHSTRPVVDVAVLSDGSLLVLDQPVATEANVTKLTSEGRFDKLFGLGDTAVVPLPGASSSALAIAINADDSFRVLVNQISSEMKLYAIGMTAGGQVDAAYGDAGQLLVDTRNVMKFMADPLDGSRYLAYSIVGAGASANLVIRRYLNDGLPDISFGSVDGIATISLPNLAGVQTLQIGRLNDLAYRIYFEKNGSLAINKLLVTAKLLEDGTLDGTYGNQGSTVATVRLDEMWYSQLSEIGNGQAIVTGRGYSRFDTNGSRDDFQIVQLDGDGTPVQSFGDQGVQAIDWALPSHFGSTMGVLQTTEALLGTVSEDALFSFYDRAGEPAADHASGGSFEATRPRPDRPFQWVALANGGFVTATVEYPSGITKIQLRRYLANGNLDTNFGTQGLLSLDGSDLGIYRLWELPNSKLLMLVRGGAGLQLMQFTSAGKVDTQFGTNGVMEFAFGTISLMDVIPAKNGSLLLMFDDRSSGQQQTRLVRWEVDNSVDNTFGTNGVFVMDSRYLGAIPVQLAFDKDGRILVVHAKADHYWLSRITATGQLDSSFADNGLLELPDQARNANYLSHAAITVAANHVFVGVTTGTRDRVVSIYAVLGNGTLDPTFGTGGATHLNESPYDDEIQNLESLVDGSVLVAYRVVDGMSAYGMLTKLEGITPSPVPRHNLMKPWNVNPQDDDLVTPMDALLLINYLNVKAAGGSTSNMDEFLLDVSADGSITPFDALLVINYINSHSSASGEGEGEEGAAITTRSVSEGEGLSNLAASVDLDFVDSLLRKRR